MTTAIMRLNTSTSEMGIHIRCFHFFFISMILVTTRATHGYFSFIPIAEAISLPSFCASSNSWIFIQTIIASISVSMKNIAIVIM